MSQPASGTRRLLIMAAVTNPFCWLPCITTARSAFPDMKTGDIRGTVFIVNPDGGRSVVNGATVRLTGPSSSWQTLTDEKGHYSFTGVLPGGYQVEVKSSGLTGCGPVTVASAAVLDLPVQLKIESIKQSVTVTARDAASSKASSEETVVDRSAVLKVLSS